jgi:hypothetical protein
LGVVINENLSWKDHIQLIQNKISKNIGVIRRIRNNLSKQTLQMLYYALINPYFDYCNIVWAGQQNVYIDSLFRLQKKALRIITYSKWNSHSAPIFKLIRVLNVYDINKIQMGCFVYKFFNGLLPSLFDNYFVTNCSIHSYNTRYSNNLHLYLPRCRTETRANSIRILGVKLWNSIDLAIRQKKSVFSFKRNYKKYLIDMY